MKTSPAVAALGNRIREVRTSRRMTQAELAEALGTSVSNYQRVEHGLQNLTITTLERIARVLGVEIRTLFWKPRTRRPPPGRPRRR